MFVPNAQMKGPSYFKGDIPTIFCSFGGNRPTSTFIQNVTTIFMNSFLQTNLDLSIVHNQNCT